MLACANVANLQLARTVAREHEVALRGVLGAGRSRLIRQFLVESLTLAAMAAVLGLGVAGVATWLIRRGGMPGEFSSGSYPAELLQAPFGKLSAAVQINGWVLAFAAGLTLLTTILFGLAPAIGASRSDLQKALQGSTRRASSGRQQGRVRSVLLMAEIGLAVVLLSGAGLLIRSFVNVLRNDSGFDPRQCLTAQIQRNRSQAPEKLSGFVQQLLPRLQALPGVQAAAIASALPHQSCMRTPRLVFGDGPPLAYLVQPRACAISVSPQYFRAAGTPCCKADLSAMTTTQIRLRSYVNQSFAHQYFHGDAFGRQFRQLSAHIEGNDKYTRITIVGIAQNVCYDGLTENAKPAIYLPFDQVPQKELGILLRTIVDPRSLAYAMRKAVIESTPDSRCLIWRRWTSAYLSRSLNSGS